MDNLYAQNRLLTERNKKLKERIKQLEHKLTTLQGLWAIDKDPKEVTKEWIDKNSFQIKISQEE